MEPGSQLVVFDIVLFVGGRETIRRGRAASPRGITCPVPSRWLRECRPSGLRPLLGLNLRGKNLLRWHPPRIQRRSCPFLQECVLLRRRTLPSSAPGACTHKSAFCTRGSVNVRFAPKATEVLRCRKLTGCF